MLALQLARRFGELPTGHTHLILAPGDLALHPVQGDPHLGELRHGGRARLRSVPTGFHRHDRCPGLMQVGAQALHLALEELGAGELGALEDLVPDHAVRGGGP